MRRVVLNARSQPRNHVHGELTAFLRPLQKHREHLPTPDESGDLVGVVPKPPPVVVMTVVIIVVVVFS